MTYESEQDKLHIKEGEKVLISRKAESNEGGWDNSWAPCMNHYVDTIGTVLCDVGPRGIRIEHLNGETWLYPYFILALIDR
jgi:hypothetical protein